MPSPPKRPARAKPQAPAPKTPAATPQATADPLQKIKHVVVLMLENRSFDNLLGWLYDGDAPARGQQFDGLTRDLWCPLDNIDADGNPFVEKVPVGKNGEPPPNGRGKTPPPAPDFSLPAPDPGEGFGHTNQQLFQHYRVASQYPPPPTNLGFVNDYRDAMLYGTYSFGDAPSDPRRIMTCYTPEQTPVLSTLARQFAVCDRWHCSVPSQTLPNRHFVHAATSDGQVNNTHTPCASPTVFNLIQRAIDGGRKDLSWKVYSGVQRDWRTGKPAPFSLTRLVLSQLQDKRLDPNFVPVEQFYADAKAGTLPSYGFIEPQFSQPGANDQHPPADIRPGERLIADVYDAVSNSPQWTETLLVVTYDEHGGCYDHVAPPGHATPPDPKPGEQGFLFNRFGVRVPAVLVSPWIEAGTVCRPAGRTPFDHTSIIATVRRVCGIAESLTARDKAAPDLGCALTLAAPRADRPSVTPLPYDPAPAGGGAGPSHDLHYLIHEILEKLTGRSRPPEQEFFDFIHEAYAEYFHGRQKR